MTRSQPDGTDAREWEAGTSFGIFKEEKQKALWLEHAE